MRHTRSVLFVTVEPARRAHHPGAARAYLNVIDTADRAVVTALEVLAPLNKGPGSSGQRDFLRKHEQILGSSAHWLEIDLLRAGTRPPDIPLSGDDDGVLHRAGNINRLEAWFMALRHPLPTIAVPLRPPVEDGPQDLHEAVSTAYDRYRYDVGIDHDDDPPAPPLRGRRRLGARDVSVSPTPTPTVSR